MKLLVILFLLKLYARINIFKKKITCFLKNYGASLFTYLKKFVLFMNLGFNI